MYLVMYTVFNIREHASILMFLIGCSHSLLTYSWTDLALLVYVKQAVFVLILSFIGMF